MAQLDHDAFDGDPRIARILDIFAKETQTDRATLRPTATLADLGVESIDLTMAVFEIESAFGVDIPVIADRAGAEFSTVGDLVGHVIAVLDKAEGVAAAEAEASANFETEAEAELEAQNEAEAEAEAETPKPKGIGAGG